MDEMRQERGPLQENQEEKRQENREEIPRQIYRPRQPEEAAGTERERRKNEARRKRRRSRGGSILDFWFFRRCSTPSFTPFCSTTTGPA